MFRRILHTRAMPTIRLAGSKVHRGVINPCTIKDVDHILCSCGNANNTPDICTPYSLHNGNARRTDWTAHKVILTWFLSSKKDIQGNTPKQAKQIRNEFKAKRWIHGTTQSRRHAVRIRTSRYARSN